MTRILLALLAFYRRWLSPALHSLSPGGCRFVPTCSEYAAVAIATHGPLRGIALAAWRLLRCHPFSRGGLDQVPPTPAEQQDLFPTNRYHRKSGARRRFSNDRKFPLPEIRNPNLQSQGPGGGGGSSGGDFRSLITFTFLALAGLAGLPVLQAQAGDARARCADSAAGAAGASSRRLRPLQANRQSQRRHRRHCDVPQSATPAIAATAETETTVENELYKIVFTNRGAQVKHWILKKYYDTAGKPLDMVQPQLAARFGFPLSFFTYDPALTTQLNQALYQVTPRRTQASTGQLLAPATLTFHYAQNGLDAVKTFHFDSSYVVDIDARRQAQRRSRCARWWPGPPAWATWRSSFLRRRRAAPLPTPSQIAWSVDGKQDTTGGGQGERQRHARTAVPVRGGHRSLFCRGLPARQSRRRYSGHAASTASICPATSAIPTARRSRTVCLAWPWATPAAKPACACLPAPSRLDVLKTIHAMGADGKPDGPSLEPLIQFGMWTVIAKPLYLALRFLRNALGTGAKLGLGHHHHHRHLQPGLMLPTRFMMMKSSLKMMRIQPKVEALKKRYAHLKVNDPKRAEMNTEMMELYKDEGVNMYGGCLPMLLQMPLFFAYYPRAAQRRRTAPGALVLAHRSLGARPSAHPAHPDHRHHVPDAVHHSFARHGSDAAAHDGLYDAGLHGIHPVALCLGAGALLGHQQHHQPGHPDWD